MIGDVERAQGVGTEGEKKRQMDGGVVDAGWQVAGGVYRGKLSQREEGRGKRCRIGERSGVEKERKRECRASRGRLS